MSDHTIPLLPSHKYRSAYAAWNAPAGMWIVSPGPTTPSYTTSPSEAWCSQEASDQESKGCSTWAKAGLGIPSPNEAG